MIGFKRSHLIIGVVLLGLVCSCSAGSWYEFFASPISSIRSWWYGRETVIPQQAMLPVKVQVNVPEEVYPAVSNEKDLRTELSDRFIMLVKSNYSAAVCDEVEAEMPCSNPPCDDQRKIFFVLGNLQIVLLHVQGLAILNLLSSQ